MQHIKNIKSLFKKNFVESPLLETFEVGKLNITSGQLIACDPILTNDKEPFLTQFPKGEFSAYIHVERESQSIAYAEISFSEEDAVHWEMATTKGQDVSELGPEEIFGYPVESGMACFMDFETQHALNELEQEIYQEKGDEFLGIYDEFFHDKFHHNGEFQQYAFLEPSKSKAGNIFAFEAGVGEGFYATYIGYDSENKPVKILTEFIEILVN